MTIENQARKYFPFPILLLKTKFYLHSPPSTASHTHTNSPIIAVLLPGNYNYKQMPAARRRHRHPLIPHAGPEVQNAKDKATSASGRKVAIDCVVPPTESSLHS